MKNTRPMGATQKIQTAKEGNSQKKMGETT